MNKKEYIKRYGGEAYEKILQQTRDWRAGKSDKDKANHRESNRKGGKRYARQLKHKRTGINIIFQKPN